MSRTLGRPPAVGQQALADGQQHFKFGFVGQLQSLYLRGRNCNELKMAQVAGRVVEHLIATWYTS